MSFSWTQGSLHSKVITAFVILGLLFAIEGGLVIYFWLRIDNHSYQLELAQESRLMTQKTAMDLQSFLRGQKDVLPTLTSTVKEADNLFVQLSQGGTWNGKNIQQPTNIQLLSLSKAAIAWKEYNESIGLLTANEIWRDSTLAANPTAESDSLVDRTAPVLRMMDPTVAKARALVDGQWLHFSALLREYELDARNELTKQRGILNWLILGIVLVDMLVLGFYYFIFRSHFLARLEQLTNATRLRITWQDVAKDELNLLGKELNELVSQIDHASNFVVQIGEGKLEEKAADTEDQSKLSLALTSMQVKLRAINEEDHKRRWANEGLTQFVEILRSGTDNLHLLGDRVIGTLVQYTKSNQGGLYLVEDIHGAKVLELISLYAFNTKKFEQQKLKPGEGLVGQCYLEKETIFLTEIPDDYIRITSGLGGANPKSLLIVPLKVDKEVFGIVELASFQVFEPHEIAFVEKLGESIASTLSSVKTNQTTKKLLEDFQQQAEQMRSQEEEMRQNMEEITATQEEMTRKEQEYLLKIKELENRDPQVVQGDDWAVAKEMERTLRIQLEMLEEAKKEF